MKKIELDLSNLYSFISEEDIKQNSHKAMDCCRMVNEGTAMGSQFLGWRNLPSSITMEQIKEIKKVASSLSEKCDVVVIIGVGGSYIGSHSAIKALTNNFTLVKPHRRPHLVWAGNNLSGDYLSELKDMLSTMKFGLIVISKSGTTLEPALTFRILKKLLEDKVGRNEASSRIVAITDESKGALRQLSQNEGYYTFTIPDDVGGRYSIFSPVGLFPMAVAGIDIEEVMEGAYNMEELLTTSDDFDEHIAAQYATVRNLMYERGKKIELLAHYEPKLCPLGQWWTQLFGESEGKDGKGLFPYSVCYSQDLHSLGQYIQEGERNMFETFIYIDKMENDIVIRKDKDDLDGLNYLAGKTIGEVNNIAYKGVKLAHLDGGVPNMSIMLSKLDAENYGALIYFFEYSCAVSAYMLGVNPFNQEGVEAYKRNMFTLLGRTDMQSEVANLKERLHESEFENSITNE